MNNSFILIFLLGIGLFSCNSNNQTKPKEEQNPMQEKIAQEKEKYNLDYMSLYGIANQESLEIYNPREQQLLSNEHIGKLGADSFVKALVGIAEEGVKRKFLNGNEYGLKGDAEKAFFIVIEENLPDDSIHSDIRFFEMRKGDKSWQLAAVSSVWKSYPGRGHQDFSTELCQ